MTLQLPPFDIGTTSLVLRCSVIDFHADFRWYVSEAVCSYCLEVFGQFSSYNRLWYHGV